MHPTQITEGTTYTNGRDQRRVVGFTNSRHRKGAQDSVRYVVVGGRGTGHEFLCLRTTFARWATALATPAGGARA